MSADVPDDADVSTLLCALRDELEATEELPVTARASPWLGEAAAVAADAADAAAEGVPETYLRERVGHVRRLLGEAGETGNDAADAHVDAAADIAATAAARLPDE